MKHKLSYIAAVWWVILCVIAGIFVLILSDKDGKVSAGENRELAGFPEFTLKRLAEGDFTGEFETFLTDEFPARDSVIRASDRLTGVFSVLSEQEKADAATREMERALERESQLKAGQTDAEAQTEDADTDASENAGQTKDADVTAVPADTKDAQDTDAQDIDAQDAAEDTQTPDASADDSDDTPEGMTVAAGTSMITDTNCYLWYEKADGSIEVQYTYKNSDIKKYSETLKLMQTYLPEDGVICFTQVPLASMGNKWTDHQKTYVNWGSSIEPVLEDCLADTQRIYVFSTYDILRPYMTGSVPMFYYTDHHWTPEATYLVFREMMLRQGLPDIPYEEYEYKAIIGKKIVDGRRDTFNALYPLFPAHSYVVQRAKRESELALMNYDYPGYLVFMNNSRTPWRRVDTGANTGRKALVICDSFGNTFAPYLLPYYDEVHMCDFRENLYSVAQAGGSIGDLIKKFGIDDVYIITSTANGLRKDNSLKYLRRFLVG
ncbi:MAG: hypothetical protein IKR85_00400 [Clostridia bacterium]|nr:hypothetical protein [Clostridia bacterium]